MKFFRDAWPVVVIAATIAGAAWTAAWNVRDFLTAQIAASETRIAARIAASETRIAAQVSELRRYVVDSYGGPNCRPTPAVNPRSRPPSGPARATKR